MKLLSGRTVFDYDPHNAKVFRNGASLVKPFQMDPGIQAATGLVYDHSPIYKNPRPTHINLTLGSDCNRQCTYCSQATNNPTGPSDPDVLLYLFRQNKNLISNVRFFVFWGGEPLLAWDKIQYITETLINENLCRPDCKFAIRTNGTMIDPVMAMWLNTHDFFVGLSHNGPWHQGVDPLEEGTPSYKGISKIIPHNLVINSVITRDGFNRSDLVNHFYALLEGNERPNLMSFQGFTLTENNVDDCLYLEDPLISMIVMYNQYKNNLAEKFSDFWPIVQGFKYRLAMQNYSILDSYNRFAYDCLNLNAIRIDLNGNIYHDHTYDCHADKIFGSLEHWPKLAPVNDALYFVGSEQLQKNCTGCPVLPLCLGGDLHTPEKLQGKECLQRFAFWAPLWTYFMNGYIMDMPIQSIRDSSFVHKDLYLDFINSSVYQAAVRG